VSPDEIAAREGVVDDEWANAAGNDHEVDVLTGEHAWRTFRMPRSRPIRAARPTS
jgi:hypothetical protein